MFDIWPSGNHLISCAIGEVVSLSNSPSVLRAVTIRSAPLGHLINLEPHEEISRCEKSPDFFQIPLTPDRVPEISFCAGTPFGDYEKRLHCFSMVISVSLFLVMFVGSTHGLAISTLTPLPLNSKTTSVWLPNLSPGCCL